MTVPNLIPEAHRSSILDTGDQPCIPQVYSMDLVVVVGFGGVAIPDDHNLAAHRNEILELLNKPGRAELATDLTGVLIVPSGIVGLLVSLTWKNITVSVYNASAEMREVFKVTHVDRLITLHEIEILGQSSGDTAASV